nr:transposase [Mycobacterium riyadhense]
MFRIARRVARDRLISTVDVEARHGHKSRARTFDGYKSHLSVDPDEELITNVAITAANTADREVIDELLNEPVAGAPADAESDDDDDDGSDSQNGSGSKGFEVYGDSAYAGGATLDEQTQRGHDMRAKVPPVRNANGYSKDQFRIDLAGRTVTCPADHTVSIRAGVRHPVARFGVLCQSCPLRAQCTKSRRGA